MPKRPLIALVLATTLVGFAAAASAVPVTRNIQFMANKNEYPPTHGSNYSACWSYIHSDGREYAVIGVGDNGQGTVSEGTAIYNVTNPAAPYRVGFVPGAPSIWREMKSYRDWIYVVTEGFGTGRGLQIIRMTNPEAPVLVATYTGTFVASHTVSVDTSRALLICNGTRNAGGNAAGIRILTLAPTPSFPNASPEAPAEIGTWPNGTVPAPDPAWAHYIHDSVPIGTRLYASSIYPGIQRVLDFSNPALPTQINEWTYPGGFTHNSWPDETGNWLYVTDEVPGQPLKVFNIGNVMGPGLFNSYSPNLVGVVHNAHVKGSELYLANYAEGIRILDISEPAHPAEFAFADSYAGLSGGFDGVWEVCPFFPSGTVIASDRQTGLYVYRPVRDYGIIRVEVQTGAPPAGAEACANEPNGCCCWPYACHCGPGSSHGGGALQGAKVYRDTNADSLTTTGDGVAVFAPDPGSHTVLARKFGFEDASDTRVVSVGSNDAVTLVLNAKPTHSFSGTVRNSVNQSPLEAAEVNLAYTPLHAHTDDLGQFSYPSVPDDVYRVEVRRPGSIPAAFERELGPSSSTQDFQLVPTSTWDALEAASGWTVGAAGDGATSGIWTRVDPIGSGTLPPAPNRVPPRGKGSIRPSGSGVSRPEIPGIYHEGHSEADGLEPGIIQPEDDRTPEPGTICFVTGQGTGGPPGEADVDGGRTSVTTPALNMTGMTTPTIGYWRWFYTSTGDPNDWLVVLISNGGPYVPVDTTRGQGHNHWMERAIRVADYVTPTSTVRLRFQAADFGPSPGSVVEAAIDDLSTYDGATPSVGVPSGGRLAMRTPWPNPSSGAMRLSLALPPGAEAEVRVLDLQGRQIRTVYRGVAPAAALELEWDGRDEHGNRVPAGLYFAQARAGTEEARVRLVQIR